MEPLVAAVPPGIVGAALPDAHGVEVQLGPEIADEDRVQFLFQRGAFLAGGGFLVVLLVFGLSRVRLRFLRREAVAARFGPVLPCQRGAEAFERVFLRPDFRYDLRQERLVVRKAGIAAFFCVFGSVLQHDGFGNLPGRKAFAPMLSKKPDDLLRLRKRHILPPFKCGSIVGGGKGRVQLARAFGKGGAALRGLAAARETDGSPALHGASAASDRPASGHPFMSAGR